MHQLKNVFINLFLYFFFLLFTKRLINLKKLCEKYTTFNVDLSRKYKQIYKNNIK